MILQQRVYKTVDGRLVAAGDPEAAFLAYPAGTELSDHAARELGLAGEDAPAPRGAKRRAKREDKAAATPEDKAGDPA